MDKIQHDRYFMDKRKYNKMVLKEPMKLSDLFLDKTYQLKIGINSMIFAIWSSTWAYCYKNQLSYSNKWVMKFSVCSLFYCTGYWLIKEIIQKLMQKNIGYSNIFLSHSLANIVIAPFFMNSLIFQKSNTLLFKYAMSIQIYGMYTDYNYYYWRKKYQGDFVRSTIIINQS